MTSRLTTLQRGCDNLQDPADFQRFREGQLLATQSAMARPLRIHIPGMLYHVMSRGNNKGEIFANEHDYKHFLRLLAQVTARLGIRCYAYCLLWNHFHLLVQVGDHSVSRMMQQLNSAYCQWFNRRHDRVGHVLQGRFKAQLVDSDVYLLRVLRYIVRNPVAAKQVAKLEDWPWSSYGSTAGLCPAPRALHVERVWAALDPTDVRSAQRQFIAFASTTLDDSRWCDLFLWDSTALASRVQPALEQSRGIEDISYAQRFAARPPLWELLPRGSERRIVRSAVRIAFFEHAYTLRELAEHLGRPKSTIWLWIHDANRRFCVDEPCRRTRPGK